MKDFLKIVKENEDTKTYLAECSINLNVRVKTTDITNAGEEVYKELDVISDKLTQMGYEIIDTKTESIDETVTESVEKDILNNTADEDLEKDIVDIFNVVETRLNKINENTRDKAIEMLKFKLSSINK